MSKVRGGNCHCLYISISTSCIRFDNHTSMSFEDWPAQLYPLLFSGTRVKTLLQLMPTEQPASSDLPAPNLPSQTFNLHLKTGQIPYFKNWASWKWDHDTQFAIADTQLALENGSNLLFHLLKMRSWHFRYPEQNMFKLLERKAQCLIQARLTLKEKIIEI